MIEKPFASHMERTHRCLSGQRPNDEGLVRGAEPNRSPIKILAVQSAKTNTGLLNHNLPSRYCG